MANTLKLFITAGTQGRKTLLDINKVPSSNMSSRIASEVGRRARTIWWVWFENASIADLMRKIGEWNGIPAESQRVIFAGKQLQIEKNGKQQYLSDYKIEDRSQLFVVLTLPGGNDPPETSDEPMRKVLDDDVELTNAPDMITWDDEPDNQRAKMPCGHAIGPESLTAYCRSLLTAGKYQFFCPYIDRSNNIYCGKVWEYYIVRRLAVLTKEEKKEFETKVSQNYMRKASGIQECPKCNSFCIRKNKKDRRVICLFCSKDGDTYEFCWFCLHDWQSQTSIVECGNSVCSGEDPRLKILRHATKKVIVGLKGCPSVRACPKCGILISHVKDCKHMVCICGQKFCFICLKIADDGVYQCGTYESHCTIAAIQDVIPGNDTSEDNGDDNECGDVADVAVDDAIQTFSSENDAFVVNNDADGSNFVFDTDNFVFDVNDDDDDDDDDDVVNDNANVDNYDLFLDLADSDNEVTASAVTNVEGSGDNVNEASKKKTNTKSSCVIL